MPNARCPPALCLPLDVVGNLSDDQSTLMLERSQFDLPADCFPLMLIVGDCTFHRCQPLPHGGYAYRDLAAPKTIHLLDI